MIEKLTAMTLVTLAAATMTGSASAPPTASVEIEVIGGPRAGHHSLVSTEAACTISQRTKRFSVNLGLPETDRRAKDPKVLTWMLVVIRNMSKAPAKPDDFEASMHFGPVLDTKVGTFYMSGVNTTIGRRGGGGSVVLKDTGKSAKVLLDLQPTPGVTIKGTLTCTNVIRY